jgi:hypothetical protein
MRACSSSSSSVLGNVHMVRKPYPAQLLVVAAYQARIKPVLLGHPELHVLITTTRQSCGYGIPLNLSLCCQQQS